jgi:hypothetical protein
MHPLAATMLALTLAAVPARAGGLDKTWISRDARWLAHIDVEAALKSNLGGIVLADAKFGIEHDDDLAEFQKRYGVDLKQDVRSVTIYGSGPDHEDPVLLVRTTQKADTLLAKVAQDTGWTTLNIGGYPLYRCTESGDGDHDESETWFVHVRELEQGGDRLLMLSNDSERLVKAINVSRRIAPNASDDPNPVFKANPSAGTILFAEVTHDVRKFAHIQPTSAIAELAESFVFEMGEQSGQVFAHLSIQTNSDEDALKIVQVAQGATALLGLAGNKKTQAPNPLVGLLGALHFNARGSLMTASFRYGAQQLVDDLKALEHMDH